MIEQSNNDYVIKIKGNQKCLFAEAQQICQTKNRMDEHIVKETNRGRKEKRIIRSYRVSEFIKQQWTSAKMIVYVQRKRKRKGTTSTTDSYYLSSVILKADEFAKGIRHHWGIENRLHYVKDVTFKEDDSKIRKGNAPEILSLIRNVAINIIRNYGANRIKQFIRQHSGNIKFLASLILE